MMEHASLRKEKELHVVTEGRSYHGMIRFLADQISVPESSRNLISAVKNFYRLSPQEQQLQLPSLYLALEQHLVDFDPNKKFLREQLREIIKTRFPELLAGDDRFDLIFHDPDTQEVLLCRMYLCVVLERCLGVLPRQRTLLEEARRWVLAAPRRAGVPLPMGVRADVPTTRREWLSLFRMLSIEVYRFLGEACGEEGASRWYQSAYEDLLELYVTLETFPVVMYMLPEGLVDRQKMALLRLGNIRRTLSAKSEQLHEITEQLLTKNNELAETRAELHKAKQDLEVRVEERTNELQEINRQLREEISERRNTEAALRASQDYTRNIIDSTLDMIVAVDKDRRITEFNKAAEATFGYTRNEVIGRHVEMLYANPESADPVRRLLDDQREGSVLEVLNRRKNGEEFSSILSASSLRDSNGAVIGYMGVSRDITDEKRREETLRQSEERFRELFEESKDVVFICSMNGRFREINPAGVELFGFTTRERLLQSDELAGILQGSEGYRAFARELLEKKFVKDYELNIRRPDGKSVTVTVTANVVRNAAEDEGWFRGIMRDVTERKHLEQQLLQSQKLESIGLLAGGIAHDINNVLTPILMALDYFKEEVKSPDGRELLDMVEASAKRGSGIVKQILMMARRVEGECFTELDIRHLVREIMKVVVETFPKTIRMRTDIPKSLWNVRGDSTQLHQILLNLTVNARDAMPDGGILTITLENLVVDEQFAKMRVNAVPGPHVVLTIADSGIGIPRENLEKIFEPFFTTKGPGKGTGLGLSTVHSIIRNHKGFVEVESKQGAGTAFKVFLPAVTTQVDERSVVHAEPPRGRGEKILIVDDEASIRGATSRTLERHGYRVTCACDGTQAIALYTREKPGFDLVITDLSMPIMDGFATIRALERIDPAVRIIASSGQSGADTSSAADQPVVHAVLQKPYTAERLLELVHATLGDSASRSRSSRKAPRIHERKLPIP